MNLEIKSGFDEASLVEKLRQVTMLKAPDVYPYKDCYISLETLDPKYLWPCQKYVLRPELRKIEKLRWALEKQDVDLFCLNGYLSIQQEGMDSLIDILPPVIEESIEENGRVYPLICDGMHRLYYAMQCGERVQVVYIRGVSKDLPYYAYPLPNGWQDVEEVDELKEGMIKKWHRIRDHHSLYRNFDSVFNSVGQPRKVGNVKIGTAWMEGDAVMDTLDYTKAGKISYAKWEGVTVPREVFEATPDEWMKED